MINIFNLGSVFASTEYYHSIACSKEQYYEYGPNILALQWKCFFCDHNTEVCMLNHVNALPLPTNMFKASKIAQLPKYKSMRQVLFALRGKCQWTDTIVI